MAVNKLLSFRPQAQVGQDNIAAFGEEHGCESEIDTAARPGDDGGFAVN
jgi:hypothetical protein